MARILVIGSSNTDMIVRLPTLPSPGQTVLGGSFWSGPGGKGANQAVAAARAGAEVAFVTSVGDDAFGQSALQGYREEGIDVSRAFIRPGTHSGVALIFVGPDGENMIGVAPGANDQLTADDIDGLPESVFADADLLLIAGLEVPLAAVERAIERASQRGLRVVLNPAPATPELTGARFLNQVDVITPNRIELGQLAGIGTRDDDALTPAARALLARSSRLNVVVTLGSAGSRVITSESVHHLPAHRVPVLDTVGAGDAFSAALSVALAEGRSLRESAAWASAAAAIAVGSAGAQSSLPSRQEIERMSSRRIT